jgi:hypothetical protein
MRPATIRRPYVYLPDFVQQVQFNPITDASTEVDAFDSDTGLIVYTTPIVIRTSRGQGIREALFRAKRFLARKGFTYSPLNHGTYRRAA